MVGVEELFRFIMYYKEIPASSTPKNILTRILFLSQLQSRKIYYYS